MPCGCNKDKGEKTGCCAGKDAGAGKEPRDRKETDAAKKPGKGGCCGRH